MPPVCSRSLGFYNVNFFFFQFGQAVSQVNDPSSLSSIATEMAAEHVLWQHGECWCWQIEVLTYNSRGEGRSEEL